jgi:hypothetical protein
MIHRTQYSPSIRQRSRLTSLLVLLFCSQLNAVGDNDDSDLCSYLCADEPKVALQAADNQQAADNKAADNKAPDNKAADNKAADNKAADNKTPDNKTPDDKAPDDKAPDDKAADDKAPDNKAQLLAEVAKLDARIQNIHQKEAAVQAEILRTRKEATDLERQWQVVRRQLEQIQTNQKKLKVQLKMQMEQLTQATATKEKTALSAQEAAKVAEQAREQAEIALKLAHEAAQLAEAAVKPIAETERQLATVVKQTGPAADAAAKAESEAGDVTKAIQLLGERIREYEQQRANDDREIEVLLRKAGEWVSFSEQIAPIFHKRCLNCHNARNAKGRLNMQSYTSLMSTGASGAAVEPGDPESSLLCQLVSQEAMPADADPLPETEIDLIRSWIERGARLDSAADPDAPLIRIMPRAPQPIPPEVYLAEVPVTALAMHSDSRQLASSGYHEVLLWSLADATLVRRITNIAERVYDIDFHPDGEQVAVASGTPGQIGEVKIFDVNSGELRTHVTVAEDSIFSVAFSPDGRRLAASGADGCVTMFHLADEAKEPLTIWNPHADWVNSVAWSPDGRWLVTASRDKTVKVLDAQTGQPVISFGEHENNVVQAMFVAEGKQVVSIGGDQKLRQWSVADGKQIRKVEFSVPLSQLEPFGTGSVATACTDGTVRVYNLASGEREHKLATTSDWLSSLIIASDLKTVITGDHAGQITLRKLDDAEAGSTWLAAP